MKKFLLGLMLVFGFSTNSADAITKSINIGKSVIPSYCYIKNVQDYGPGNVFIVYGLNGPKFLRWIKPFLNEYGYQNITDVKIKYIHQAGNTSTKTTYIEFVKVEVTYDYFRN